MGAAEFPGAAGMPCRCMGATRKVHPNFTSARVNRVTSCGRKVCRKTMFNQRFASITLTSVAVIVYIVLQLAAESPYGIHVMQCARVWHAAS